MSSAPGMRLERGTGDSCSEQIGLGKYMQGVSARTRLTQ